MKMDQEHVLKLRQMDKQGLSGSDTTWWSSLHGFWRGEAPWCDKNGMEARL